MNNRSGPPLKFESKLPAKFEPKTPVQVPARNAQPNQSTTTSALNELNTKASPVGGVATKTELKSSPSPVISQDSVQNRGNRFAGATNERGHNSNQGLKRDFRSAQQTGSGDTNDESASDSVVAKDDQADGQSLHKEKKFSGRCRLFVGNLPGDMTENEFKKMFDAYGEYSEVFLNSSRGFGFIRFDTRHHAEDARSGVDGKVIRNRPLRVRFAAHSAALRVRYLSPHTSNEMLAEAFSIFGEVERAVVCVDDRGKPSGEGIVEFARKPGATTALKRISEGVFLMTASPRPIAVELLEQTDENDGLPEVFIQKSGDVLKERDQPPRFAQVGSFEYEFGLKWKTLYQLLHEQQEALKKNFEEEVLKMEMDMDAAQMEQHTVLLRQDLMRRQEELRRLEEQTQMEIKRRMDARRQDEERRRPQNNMDSYDIRRSDDAGWRQQQKQSDDDVYGERRGSILPPPGMGSDNGRMLPGQMMQRNERGGTLAPGAVMARSDRGLMGIAPPLQPPPVPPIVHNNDRSRQQPMGGPSIPVGMMNPPIASLGQSSNGDKNMQQMQMITAAQQISKLIPQIMQQPQQRSRFDHPQQGMSGPGVNIRGPGGIIQGPGMDNPRSGGPPGGRDDFFDAKRMRRF